MIILTASVNLTVSLKTVKESVTFQEILLKVKAQGIAEEEDRGEAREEIERLR